MKTNYFVIAALAATTLFASCNKDNNRINENGGQATSMKVSISFPSPATRGTLTADPNATNEEVEIRNVDIFIYTASGAFSSHEHLLGSAFTWQGANATPDADVYTTTTKIATTTGSKSVYVGINLPAGLAASLEDKPASELATAVKNLTAQQLTNAPAFTMFSTVGVTRTFEADENAAANKITVKCQRLVAKVTVETKNGYTTDGVPAGTLGNLQYVLYNVNKKMYLLQGTPEARKDPNWDAAGYDNLTYAGDFENMSNWASILSSTNFATPEDYQTAGVVRYATENTSERKFKKEITRVLVSGTFIPAKLTQSDGAGGFLQITNPNISTNTVVSFWAVTPSPVEGSYFFSTEAGAQAFATSKGMPTTSEYVLFYNNGLCYWDIFLDKVSGANRWDVLRNDYYKCTINSIKALGRPGTDLPDPNVTPDTETKIDVTIEVLFWVLKAADYDLE